MRMPGKEQKASSKAKSATFVKSGSCRNNLDAELHPGLHLQKTIGNQAVQRLFQAKTEGRKDGPPADAISETEGLESQLSSSKGEGHALPAATRGYMEQAFGVDFGAVRVHTDRRAEQMNHGLDGRAFTHGTDIYFNHNQYEPKSSTGKHLIAHELTHVIQQGGSQQQINLAPNPAAPPDPYVPGRPAHNHPALGNWAAVQANASAVCSAGSVKLPLPIPIPVPVSTRARAECACSIMSPLKVLDLAKAIRMRGKPLAKKHLEHYISGGGADYIEHTNLDNLMKTDAGARGVVAGAVSKADRGQVFIQQHHYSDQNFRLAFGGIDRVDYKVDKAKANVDVWFKDRYDFHPAGFGHTNKGAGDYAPPGRVSNCVHLAAVEAKSSGAADYWMIGHATLPLSLFTAAPKKGKGDIL